MDTCVSFSFIHCQMAIIVWNYQSVNYTYSSSLYTYEVCSFYMSFGMVTLSHRKPIPSAKPRNKWNTLETHRVSVSSKQGDDVTKKFLFRNPAGAKLYSG
jgi:hypothetical protein